MNHSNLVVVEGQNKIRNIQRREQFQKQFLGQPIIVEVLHYLYVEHSEKPLYCVPHNIQLSHELAIANQLAQQSAKCNRKLIRLYVQGEQSDHHHQVALFSKNKSDQLDFVAFEGVRVVREENYVLHQQSAEQLLCVAFNCCQNVLNTKNNWVGNSNNKFEMARKG